LEQHQRSKPGGVRTHGVGTGTPAFSSDGRRVRRCARLLHPSTDEGFGFPPLEALALCVPAKCADLPPIAES
jgi:hypothetical protein